MEEASYRILEGEYVERPLHSKAKASACPVRLGVSGVRVSDARGELTQRRLNELQKSQKPIRVQDNRTWVALKMEYTYAEQRATKQFKTTVLFEPWGGCFGCTRFASQFMGWTCSQPFDLLYGYDLISSRGQRLLWNTLEQHDPYLTILAFDCRIWSLLQNMSPPPSMTSSMNGRLEARWFCGWL